MILLFSLIAFIAVLFRWCISENNYSGFGKPPMFGDYEAQRHWMEITLNLPINQWYINSTENDLLYWGLDYPPLTAYHSFICGYVANSINSTWVALGSSRGHESYDHKLFMRSSVLLMDVLIFLPAVFVFFSLQKNNTQYKQMTSCLLMLFYPGLALIDYGHFQYNCVSLGFTLWAVNFLCMNHDLIGSIMFCLAVNYKQMELYHAMPFFCYLLGSCFKTKKENRFFKLMKIAVVVLCTFAACWSPFLSSKESAVAVLKRLFPFGRGLYEDKVSNLWCTLSVVVKLKQIIEQDKLVLVCLVSTLLMLMPASIHLMMKPSHKNFKLALISSSLVFFLFSFQVHEKSILLAALPACFLLSEHLLAAVWFLSITTFSMLPLLIKDGLLLPYIASSILFLCLSLIVDKHQDSERPKSSSRFTIFFFVLSLFGCAILTGLSAKLHPPPTLPDLWPVLISAYSFIHFILFLVYFHYLQFRNVLVHKHTEKKKKKH